MKLSSKIALSIWTAIVLTGLTVGIVIAAPLQAEWEVVCFVTTILWGVGLAGLCLAIVTTLAWCGIE